MTTDSTRTTDVTELSESDPAAAPLSQPSTGLDDRTDATTDDPTGTDHPTGADHPTGVHDRAGVDGETGADHRADADAGDPPGSRDRADTTDHPHTADLTAGAHRDGGGWSPQSVPTTGAAGAAPVPAPVPGAGAGIRDGVTEGEAGRTSFGGTSIGGTSIGGTSFGGTAAGPAGEQWREVLLSFVDDPRKSVERADGLVDEAVRALRQRIDDEHQGLRETWHTDGEPSTEDLRSALRGYRDFFEKVLGYDQKAHVGSRSS